MRTVAVVLVAALFTVTVAACGTEVSSAAPPGNAGPSNSVPTRKPSASATRTVARITYPAHGSRTWKIAPAREKSSPENGGTLLRYRVELESDIAGVSPAAFAGDVSRTLNDRRGWTAGGRWRFQQVGAGARADFTIYLVTPDTRDRLCQDVPDGYTSCRRGDRVVLNVARWAKGVAGYPASLAVYREYMVNHEVGHRLGHGHELCPGEGDPAPVMQQQTLGMHGCAANPWPFPQGNSYYHGESGTYGDRPPAREQGRR